MSDKLRRFEELVRMQCTDGTWNYDPYQFGMANGLLLALSVIKGTEYRPLDRPDRWLADIPCMERDDTARPALGVSASDKIEMEDKIGG